MKTNFEIEDNIAVKNSFGYYDLHNEFDFIKLEFDIRTNEISLFFKKSYNILDNDIFDIKFIHNNINYYMFGINGSSVLEEDRETLANISFFPTDDKRKDSLTFNSFPNENDQIIYLFENESYIRIGCKEIKLCRI